MGEGQVAILLVEDDDAARTAVATNLDAHHYEVRAVPAHPHLSHPYELGLMRHL